MRSFLLSMVVLSVCFIDGARLVAQRPQSGNYAMWQGGVGPLGYVRVRDELKLTDIQMARIKDIGDEFMEKHFRTRETSKPDLNPTYEESRRRFDELGKLEREFIEKAKGVLTPEQATRYRQVEIWLSGPSAFNDPPLARELNLTDEQRNTLKAIADEYMAGLDALYKSLHRDSRRRPTKEEQETRAEKIAEVDRQRQKLHAAKDAECLAALTDEQKVQFLELRGKEFDIRWNPIRGN